MGSFVTLFNYIGYRLMLSPWELSQAVVGLLSVAYLTGTWSSPKAGSMTTRYGRVPVMLFSTGVMLVGLLMTLFTSLWLIFAGMLLFSAGFFAAHSVASSWIGPRAKRAKGQASSLYLFSYYRPDAGAGVAGRRTFAPSSARIIPDARIPGIAFMNQAVTSGLPFAEQ